MQVEVCVPPRQPHCGQQHSEKCTPPNLYAVKLMGIVFDCITALVVEMFAAAAGVFLKLTRRHCLWAR
jgi:hypothetical protein